MACPCGLTQEKLLALSLVSEQKCTAIYESNGTEKVCGKLFTSHPSDQGKTLSI